MIGEEISSETKVGNRLIAEFLGYKYYHAGIDIDYSDCGGIYDRKEIFSKAPILSKDYPDSDQYYFADLPNPDYNNPSFVTKWRTDFKTLSWDSLNSGQWITDLDYHSNWNSLMNVVEAIESLGDDWNPDTENYHIIISKRYTRVIYDWGTYSTYDPEFDNSGKKEENFKKFQNSSKDYRHIIFDGDKKMSTWQAIVDFLEWRNAKQNG